MRSDPFFIQKMSFLQNIKNDILSEIEYYKQNVHICFDGEKFYVNVTTWNSFDIWVTYIDSFEMYIPNWFYKNLDLFQAILDDDVVAIDIIEDRWFDLEKLKNELNILINQDNLKDYEIVDILNNIFSWFDTVFQEFEKDSYIIYIWHNIWYTWVDLWDRIRESIDKVIKFRYEDHMKK